MAWVVLVFAGIFEIVWAYSMKLSEGFTKLGPSLVTLFFYDPELWFVGLCHENVASRNGLYYLDRNRRDWFISCGYFYTR